VFVLALTAAFGGQLAAGSVGQAATLTSQNRKSAVTV